MSNCKKTKTKIVQLTDLGNIDFTTLTPAQCQAIFQCIVDEGTEAQFDDLCAAIGIGLTVSTGPDGVVANATSSEDLNLCQTGGAETLHFFSPDNSILFTVSSGSVILGAQINPVTLAGIPHTVITNIDLKPTGNANQFTVEIQWTDGDGNAQTTTDPTPVLIAVDNNITSWGFSNTEYNLLTFPPAQPVNAHANPTTNDTYVERYSNGLAYFTYNGATWDITLFETDDNQVFTHRDESALTYTEGSLSGPQNPPANPGQGDVHMERYDNALVFFNYQEFGPGAGWDGNNVTFVPLGGEHVPDSNILSGTVDGDALLADLVDNQAYHFHAVFGDVNLTSASEIANATNGLVAIQGAVAPFVIPNGTQGFIRRDGSTLTVHYNTNDADLSTQSRAACFTPTNDVLPKETIYEHYTLEDETFVSLGYTLSEIYVAGDVLDLATYQGGGAASEGECPCLGLDVTQTVPYRAVDRTVLPSDGLGSIGTSFVIDDFGGVTTTEKVILRGKCGTEIPATITFEHLSGSGGGNLTYDATAQNILFHGAGGSDFTITITLDDPNLSYAWGLWSSSIGTGENVIFDQGSAVTSYDQGADGIAITLPFAGSWNNDNNNNYSAFGFDAANSISFRKLGSTGAGGNVIISLLEGPEAIEVDVCNAVNDHANRLAVIEAGGFNTFGTVLESTANFTTTDGVQVKNGGFYRLFPDGTTSATPSIEEYNNFIGTFGPQYIAISYEAAGGASLRANVNGVDATYTDLLNATDNGTGQVAFAGGANGNFNRRARIDATVLEQVGDYVEILAVDVSPFSQVIAAVVSDPADLAHTTSGVYSLRATAGGNGNVEVYNFRDRTNAVVVSGGETNAVYRITRTLAGVSFSRDGVELYCSSVDEFTDYSGVGSHADDDVETVTGEHVDNTDARNPIIRTLVEDVCYQDPATGDVNVVRTYDDGDLFLVDTAANTATALPTLDPTWVALPKYLPSCLALPVTPAANRTGGVGAGEPSVSIEGYLMYIEEDVAADARFAGASNIANSQEQHFIGVYFDGTDWRYSDNGENGAPAPLSWITFTPLPTDILMAKVSFGNGPVGGSIFNGAFDQNGVTHGIWHVKDLGGATSVAGNSFTNGSANSGEFFIEDADQFSVVLPTSPNAVLQLDGTYLRDDGTALTYADAVANGWVPYHPDDFDQVGTSPVTLGGAVVTDLGATRIISGRETMTADVHTLDFGAVFADDQFQLVTTAIDNQAFFVTENDLPRTTSTASVSMYNVNGVNQQSDFSWIAIGKAP